ncbi:amidohydrolase [Microvirga sp. VF16]|uniref:amidohydrolase family protein n=1 Tax=Microvirga sp. VF16 TaxID=2807101 RepID=UPI00193D63D0|nr:amidohydrolase family protein [Microvirga sp. VF16]QRM34233.1 amidohydrolase family protein [Microvirga sp. VF16]
MPESVHRNALKMHTPAAAAPGLAQPSDVSWRTRQPRFAVPPGACDCHVHVFHPEHFPYAPDRTYTPGAATVEGLDLVRKSLGISRVVLVQPSVYGTDNRCLLSALATLGPDVARGVAVIDPETVSDVTLQDLHKSGVRGVRVNLESKGERSSGLALSVISAISERVMSFGLAVQVYADLKLIADMADDIAQLRVPLILDHFGGAKAALGVEQYGFRALTELLRTGAVWVKLSGVYRASQDKPSFSDIRPIAEALIEANHKRLVWASDWPHTGGLAERAARQPTDIEPFQQIDDAHVLDLLAEWAGDPARHHRILVDNAAELFDFA